ncbi:hypothetical protein [Streptomyces umbrinus]|uniref:hypothetical protein n=1 Tax=Streptomyces umbrinus TaxID=67370 RepID=UPI0016757C59|nr:hypothetical protein [Streptomyces umbrinus]
MVRNQLGKVHVKPGDVVAVRLGASECMMSMGLTGKVMAVRILEEPGFGQLRDRDTGRDYSMPNPLGWMSFFQDADGWYSDEIRETGLSYSVTHTSGRFYVYVGGKQMYGVQSLRFEEMCDAAREVHSQGISSAEVRFVENSRFLSIWWSRSTVVPLDTEVREEVTRSVRDTWVDLPEYFNLFAGRQHLKEV